MSRSIKVDQINDAIIAAPSDVTTLFNKLLGGSVSYSGTTYADIRSDLADQDFEVPVTGWYQISLRHQIYNSSTGADGRLKVIFDESDYNGFTEQSIVDDTGGSLFFNCTDRRGSQLHSVGPVYLEAGTHNITLQWKFVQGAGNLVADTATPFYCTATLLSGSGAGGIIENSVELAADFTITNTTTDPGTSPNWQDIDNGGGDALSLDVVTATELVEIVAEVACQSTASGYCAHWFGIEIDGAVVKWKIGGDSNTGISGILGTTFSIVTSLSAGTHTIKLVGSRHTNDQNVKVFSAGSSSVLRVKQYRGGLVPIDSQGVEVASKPQRVNYSGSLEASETDGTVTVTNGGLIVADAFNNSNIDGAWTQINGSNGNFSEDTTKLSITPTALTNWYGGTYDAPFIQRIVPSFKDFKMDVFVYNWAAANYNGFFLQILNSANYAQSIQIRAMYHTGYSGNCVNRFKDATTESAIKNGLASNEAWIRLVKIGRDIYYYYIDGGYASKPSADDDWTFGSHVVNDLISFDPADLVVGLGFFDSRASGWATGMARDFSLITL